MRRQCRVSITPVVNPNLLLSRFISYQIVANAASSLFFLPRASLGVVGQPFPLDPDPRRLCTVIFD